MNTAPSLKQFYLGSHLCREPMPPMAELKRDLENLKKNGFNLVKLQENWMVDEPLEGQIDLSKYEELIAHAASLDMGVYLGLTCEQAPGWLYEKYPDCRMVGRNGVPVYYEAQYTLPTDGKPGPCYDHPGARAEMERFITALVYTLGRYENVVIWNTWQEIDYWSDNMVGQHVCYCQNTLHSFRAWLQTKYGSLEALNRAWQTRYGDWKYVAPDRGAYRKNALPSDIDWFYFMDHVQISHVLQARAKAIRAADTFQRPIFAHLGGIHLGHGQDWAYARSQDFLGSSCYPAWASFHAWDDTNKEDKTTSLRQEMWAGVALTFDYVRSANPPGSPTWAAEFQGGRVSNGFHIGRIPSPEDIRRWMLTAVGSGVSAISFWVTRAEIMAQEANGFSLLNSTGESTPRLAEAGRVGAALIRHSDLFGGPTLEQAPVAILVDAHNAKYNASMIDGNGQLAYSMRGWHRLLWDLGIPMDFVSSEYLDETPLLPYKAVILPFPLSLSDTLARHLAEYTRLGGNLICEANPGQIDEHAVARRGELSPVLAELAGVRHAQLVMIQEPGGQHRFTPLKRTWGEFYDAAMLQGVGVFAGEALRANIHLETFSCTDGQPILMHDLEVAGVMRSAGQGKVWLVGTYIGHSGTAHRDEQTSRFVQKLLSLCGVTPLHQGRLLLRRRRLEKQSAWIFTNPTNDEVVESFDAGVAVVSDLLNEPFEQAGSRITVRVPPLDVRVLISQEQ